ncbi:MAG TPA: AI-2E family transporter [Steroidobacteraceae bacterium]|nr:AI-2E family transporter [Steroidobacteraceae bacterium]
MSTPDVSAAQKTARYALIGALVFLGAWELRRFLPALCWAIVLAIATSAVYDRWLARFRGKHRDVWAALTFTTLIGIVLIVPLVYVGIVAVREAISLAHTFMESTREGPPQLPQWLLQLPLIGDWTNGWVKEIWMARPGHAELDVATGTVQTKPAVYAWTRLVGVQLLRRVTTLVFTLLTLYFVYLNRDQLKREVPRVSRRMFGPTVEPLMVRVVQAIRATVDGVVLVAVAEGAVMCAVYAIAGAPHPILLGAVTGIFAMIPFAAPIVFGAVAILLASDGAVGAGVGVAIAGSIVLFIADHFVRPAIIGGGARLPFLWVLLGILGGIESFGLVGIFLGPALMAALVSLWRGWVSDEGAVIGGG